MYTQEFLFIYTHARTQTYTNKQTNKNEHNAVF